MSNDVRFIRVNGRVVPVRNKNKNGKSLGSLDKKKAPTVDVSYKFKTQKVSLSQRMKDGFKAGGIMGGIFGSLAATADSAKTGKQALLYGAAGAVGGAVGFGSLMAGINGLIGPRKQLKIETYITKKKKSKSGI